MIEIRYGRFFLLLLFFLSGCSFTEYSLKATEQVHGETYKYREISELEVNKFIPYGYKLVEWYTPSWYSTNEGEQRGMPIKINLDKDKEKELILFLQSTEGVKIIALDYKDNKDTWEIMDTYEPYRYKNMPYNFGIPLAYNNMITDLDNDGIEEIQLEYMFYGGTDTNSIKRSFLTIKDGHFVDLLPDDAFTNIEDDGFIVYKDKTVYVVSYIWGSGESRYGCHQYQVKIYAYDGGNFVLKNNYKTISKFVIDIPSEHYDCTILENNEKLLENIFKDIGVSKQQ